MTERTNLTPEERASRLKAWQEQGPLHDPLPFVQGVMEGKRPGDVWKELHPDTTPSSCMESASRALTSPKVKALLSESQIARAQAIGRDTTDLLVEYWKRYNVCVAKGDEKNARLILDSLTKHYGGFENSKDNNSGRPIQINVIYQGRPEVLPSVQVVEVLPDGNYPNS